MSQSLMYWVHAITPLHIGAGRGVGFIDLPIMREKATNYPLAPGSAVKGVLRDYFEQRGITQEVLGAAFGKSSDDEGNSGSLMFSDARLVCLPVRSFYGTFAYATSPMALRFLDKLQEIQAGKPTGMAIPQPAQGSEALVAGNSLLAQGTSAFLEDLDFQVHTDKDADQWAKNLATWVFQDPPWQTVFTQRFIILHDSALDYLLETGTEVNARIRLEDTTKIVAPGALWYEESLPAQSILAGLVTCDRVFGKSNLQVQNLTGALCTTALSCQIGGKATTGKGQVVVRFV